MSEDEREMLGDLGWFAAHPEQTHYQNGWCRPMDLGGSNGSPHSGTLGRMVKRGWVERWNRAMFGGTRGSYLYRITDAGREALAVSRPGPPQGGPE
jgi:hypothetical protein